MHARAANSSRINTESRCAQIFANGKRCRLSARPNSTLCPTHAGSEAAELASVLTAGMEEFTSPEPINKFLSRLLLLLAQDRISPRRGAVMAHVANLLLRSVTVMKELEEKEPVEIEYVIGIPRPAQDDSTNEPQGTSSSSATFTYQPS